MRPRLAMRLAQPVSTNSVSIASFLLPFLHRQARNASILSSLSDPGSYNKPIRRGRGPSSGKGKTSGRGHKGQKQHGKVPKGFQGGQTPEEIVHGKYGFKNIHAVEMSPVNLDKIQTWINAGRLDASKPITLKELTSSRVIHGIKDGVKLLANGATTLTSPIHIVVSRASQAAIDAVEKLGGSVTTRFYTPVAIRRIRQGLMHPYISMRWEPSALSPSLSTEADGLAPAVDQAAGVTVGATPQERVTGLGFQYRLPDPSSRKDIEYYRDLKNRGYLAHTVQEGETASLYFKAPVSEDEIKRLKRSRGQSAEVKKKEENKLW